MMGEFPSLPFIFNLNKTPINNVITSKQLPSGGRIFGYRSSCQPFIASDNARAADKTHRAVLISMIATVLEPIEVTDSYVGSGGFSIQGQCNEDDLQWAQMAFQFRNLNGKPLADFTIEEYNPNLEEGIWIFSANASNSSNPLPVISGLDAGYVYTMQWKDDGQNAFGFASIQDPSGNIIWQSGDISFTKYGHPTNINALATGYGSSATQPNDITQWTSGHFRFQYLATDAYNDLAYVQINPLAPVYSTPCGPLNGQTAEGEGNMKYTVTGPSSGIGIGFDEHLSTVTLTA